MNPEENKLIYNLGFRDAWAIILMEKWHEKIKDQNLAKKYEENFGYHPSLKFHNGKEVNQHDNT